MTKRINHLKSEKVEYIGEFKIDGKWSAVTNYCDSESQAQTWINNLLEIWKQTDDRPEGIRIIKVTTTYEVVR